MEVYENYDEYSYVEQAVQMHLSGLDMNQQENQNDNPQNDNQNNNQNQQNHHINHYNNSEQHEYTQSHLNDGNNLNDQQNENIEHYQNGQQIQNNQQYSQLFGNIDEKQSLLQKNEIQKAKGDNKKQRLFSSDLQGETPLQKKKRVLDVDNMMLDIVNFKRIEASQEKKVTKRLVFIITITSPTTQYEKTIQVTYDVFSKTMIGIVSFGYKLLSISNYECLEMEDSQNDQQVQEYVRTVGALLKVFKFQKRNLIQKRPFVIRIQLNFQLESIQLKQVQEMINLNEDKNAEEDEYLNLLPTRVIHKQDIIEEELEISCCYQDTVNNIIYVTQQNLTPLSRLGRIWSFIDSQILGSILAFRVQKDEGCLIPKYTLVSKKYFDFRLLSLEFVQEKNLLLLGSHHGYLYHQTIGQNEPLNKKSNSIYIGNEEIIKITIFPSNQYALLLMPTSIKIFDLNTLQIVAGGSLKKRLEGAELTCSQIDSNNQIIYLDNNIVILIGTSKGGIMNYEFNNFKLDYCSTHFLDENLPISSIIIYKEYLFSSQGAQCGVFKIKKQKPELQLQLNGQFDLGNYVNTKHNNMKLRCPIYIPKSQLFISGTDTGMIIFWSVKNGNVLSVIQVTQDSKSIVSIQYLENENYLLVTLQEGTKILKLGKMQDSLMNEVKKNFNYID